MVWHIRDGWLHSDGAAVWYRLFAYQFILFINYPKWMVHWKRLIFQRRRVKIKMSYWKLQTFTENKNCIDAKQLGTGQCGWSQSMGRNDTKFWQNLRYVTSKHIVWLYLYFFCIYLAAFTCSNFDCTNKFCIRDNSKSDLYCFSIFTLSNRIYRVEATRQTGLFYQMGFTFLLFLLCNNDAEVIVVIFILERCLEPIQYFRK